MTTLKKFSIDESEQSYEGISNSTWNGFECPEFEFEEARRLMENMNAYWGSADVDERLTYDEQRDCFIYLDGSDPDEKQEMSGVIGEDGVKRYAIGAFGWCWLEC